MIAVRNICKCFGSVEALREINFRIGDDEIVSLIGPSGCGKSTLLNIISGLSRTDSGVIEGADCPIACVFQDDRLLPWRTVEQNIRIVKDEADATRIQELIDAVGLTGFEKHYPSELSGGMKKRCGIARAFYYQSKLLLMDEPFQALDFYLRQEMVRMLLRVWKQNKQSVLFVTHEIDEALAISSKIIVLSDRPGRILGEFVLPGEEGRDPMAPEIASLKQEIYRLMRNTESIAMPVCANRK